MCIRDRYYESHKADYTIPEKVRASHILVETEQDAEEIIELLAEGADFEGLARERSLAVSYTHLTPPRLELYGEIFIDDAQQSISNRTFIPDMVGGLIGIDLPALPGNLRLGANIEYVAQMCIRDRYESPLNSFRSARALELSSSVCVMLISFRSPSWRWPSPLV